MHIARPRRNHTLRFAQNAGDTVAGEGLRCIEKQGARREAVAVSACHHTIANLAC